MRFLDKILKGKHPNDARPGDTFEKSSSDTPAMNLQESRELDALPAQEVPEARFVVTKGVAELSAYRVRKERVLVGRLRDVLDREGRIVRRNDIIFLEGEHEINASVEPAHARIWYDHKRHGYCILDEGSHYGTHVVRNGLALDVPGVDSHGIQLQSEDDIYLGQACLHFDLKS